MRIDKTHVSRRGFNKVTRRKLIKTGSAAVAVGLSSPVSAKMRMRFSQPSGGSPTIPINVWTSLPMGGGGYVTGINADDSGNLYCKTDVFNAYKLLYGTTTWISMNNKASWGVSVIPSGSGGQVGVYDIFPCESNPNYVYQIMAARSPDTYPTYALHYSSNGGANWSQSPLKFNTASAQGDFGNDRFANNKMAVDPNNALHVIVGGPNRDTLNPGQWRSFDGGVSVQKFDGTNNNGLLPAANLGPGAAGIVFDRRFGTVLLPNGSTVTKRILWGIGGKGYYETFDGGQTWSQISKALVPSSGTITYTTTQPNSVIFVQAYVIEYGEIDSITNVGGGNPSTLVWNKRQGINYGVNPYGNGQLEGYWAVAPNAGTYTFQVNYAPGTLAVGANGVANLGNVFAVKNVDVSGGTGSGGASTIFCTTAAITGGQAQDLQPYTLSLTLAATGLIFACSGSRLTATDASFTAMANNSADGNVGFWCEIGTAPATGTVSGIGAAAGADAVCVYADAMRQAGGTIALDGTPVAFESGPAPQLTGTLIAANTDGTPVNPCQASMSYGGYLFVTNGPSPGAAGGLWRYTRGASAGAGTWARMDGASGTAPGLGTPGRASTGNAAVVNTLSGQDGKLTCFGYSGKLKNGWQTTNATAEPVSGVAWVGSGDYSGTNPTVLSPQTPWLVDAGDVGIGGCCFNPVDGTYWSANGLGVVWYPANFSFDVSGYSLTYTWLVTGIEESYVQQIQSVPGSDNVLIATEDRNMMLTTHAQYEAGLSVTNYFPVYEDTHAWCIDYDAANPAFVTFYSAGLHPGKPLFSFSYGDASSWANWGTTPYGNVMPGQVIVSTGSTSQTLNAATFNATLKGVSSAPCSGTFTIGTGSFSFTTTAGLQDYFFPGMGINMIGIGSANSFMIGTVTSYVNATGAIVVNITNANAQTPTDTFTLNTGGYYSSNNGQKILVMTSVVGTPQVGDLLIYTGVTANTTLASSASGVGFPNSWLLSNDSLAVNISTAMSLTRNAGKLFAIIGNQGNNLAPVYSNDCTKSWQAATGLPTANYNPGAKEGFALNCAADKVLADYMYCINQATGLYRSTNGGASWSLLNGSATLNASYPMLLWPVPGKQGHLWWCSASGFGPSLLYHSTNADTTGTFTSISGIDNVSNMAIGATKPGSTYPTIIISGRKISTGITGNYYSIDEGANWTLFSSTVVPARDFGSQAWLSGDLNKPGRFYSAIYSSGAQWIQLW